MSFPFDTSIGRYEIRAPLGAGGMGQVYFPNLTNIGSCRISTHKLFNVSLALVKLMPKSLLTSNQTAAGLSLPLPNERITDGGQYANRAVILQPEEILIPASQPLRK